MWAGAGLHAQPMPDPISDNFYPPELLQQARAALGLTEEQAAALQEACEKVQPRLAELQQRLKEETRRLAALVGREKLEEESVIGQAELVMRLERDIKRGQLVLLIRIKNLLTPEQQAKLRELKDRMPALLAKLREAHDLAQKAKQEGRDVSWFDSAREQFEALAKAGKFKEAEALLDRSLKALKAPPSQPKR